MAGRRSRMLWHEEELDYIKAKIANKEHPIDYYGEFNKYRATILFDKHTDPNFKVPRSLKSIENKLRQTFGVKLSSLNKVSSYTRKSVEDSFENKEYMDAERKVNALREAARQQRSKYNKLLRDMDFQDRVIEITAKYLQQMDTVTPPKVTLPSEHKTEVEALSLWSDFHIGERIDLDQMGGINEYNFDIFKHRLAYNTDVIIDLVTNKLVGYNITKLNIGMLGDMVTGEIHDELVETAEGTVIEWCYGGAIVIAQALMELAQVFPQIDVYGVVGNHGRTKKKPYFKNRYVNWDYVLYMSLALMLRTQPNIKFYFPKSFFITPVICGHEFMFLHGDNIRSWSGIPFYGINRAVANFNQLMASEGEFLKYICMGHFHEAGTLDKAKGQIILNGSLVGGNEYSLGRLFSSSKPTQFFSLIHHEKGINLGTPIDMTFADTSGEPRYEYDFNANLIDEFGRILTDM